MKLTFAILAALLTAQSYAQVTNAEMRGDFAEAAKLGRLQGAESLPTYASNNVKGTRYLTPDWATGKIVSTKDQHFDNAKLMFDKQDQDVYLQAASGQIILINKDQIRNFTIDNHFFVSGTQLHGGDPLKYYERLAGNDKGITLYKQVTTKFIKANRNDADRIKRGDFDDEYRDDVAYYVATPQQPIKAVKISERSFSKALPDQASKIRSFFDAHYNDEQDEKLITLLINSLNG